MIALVEDLPLVEFSEGRIFAFRSEWLQKNLLHAADRAGYPNWWLASHVTQSVTYYLASEFTPPVVKVERLTETVQAVLESIGYAEVGEFFRASRPAREISLLQVVEAASGYEMAFFEELKSVIRLEIEEGAECICLTRLGPCVKMLRGVKYFTRECSHLRDEIVCFASQFAQIHATEKRSNTSLHLR